MKKYKCEFPDCDYETTVRRDIDEHHIVPKSMGGSDKGFNKVYLCPNHHRKIYVEGCEHGFHSQITIDSIQIINIYKSTDGKVIHYKDVKNNEYAYYLNKNKIVEW